MDKVDGKKPFLASFFTKHLNNETLMRGSHMAHQSAQCILTSLFPESSEEFLVWKIFQHWIQDPQNKRKTVAWPCSVFLLDILTCVMYKWFIIKLLIRFLPLNKSLINKYELPQVLYIDVDSLFGKIHLLLIILTNELLPFMTGKREPYDKVWNTSPFKTCWRWLIT